MKPSNSSNPLIQCPFCKKRMKGKTLAGHVKRLHADDPKFATQRRNLAGPLLEGIEIKSPELVHELKRRVIDEHGFLVSTDLIPETKVDADQERHFHRSASKPSTQGAEQSPNIFDSIKSLDAGIPGARTKKLRPKPDQEVFCPVCQKHVEYQVLFEHVSRKHPEKNAKFVLARFNRDYEIWAKNKPSKR